MYEESISEARQERESQAQAANYMREASKFSNPYGMGNMEKGGKMPKYFLGGFFNFVEDVFTTVTQPAAEILEVFGDTFIEPVTENFLQPALDTGFEFVEAGGELAQMGIETGVDLAMQGIDFAGGMAGSVMETVGEKVVFPVMEGVAQGVEGILGGDDDDFQLNVPPPTMKNPNIQTVETVQNPNIVTIDPYTNKPVEKAFDFSMASGSAGFVRPDDIKKKTIYKETQEAV